MALLNTLHIAHLPEDLQVYLSLYDEVKNAGFLQQQLLQGNSAFEYAFIDASIIISSNHLLAAVFRAANDWLNGRMKSKNVHSEIVFCLSMNNNIVESFRRFGISPATTSLYAIKVSRTPSVNAATVQQHLSNSIEGKPFPFEESAITRFTDVRKVKKTYKLTDLGRSKVRAGREGGAGKGKAHEDARLANGDNGEEEAERKELEIMVLGLMALRGAT
ncbi:MAG: hypothetical protein Q9197_002038 [Variospora fuerteventurae]